MGKQARYNTMAAAERWHADKMRNDNGIEWLTILGKIYYKQASFVQLLEKNKLG